MDLVQLESLKTLLIQYLICDIQNDCFGSAKDILGILQMITLDIISKKED